MLKEIISCNPQLDKGMLQALEFTLKVSQGDFTDYVPWYTPAHFPEREEPYTQDDYLAEVERIAQSNGLWDQMTARVQKQVDAALPPVIQPPVEPIKDPVVQRTEWYNNVDDLIADIITKQTRFQMGYVEREAAANAYKDSGYKIDPTEWITRFADNVKIPYPAAADLILSQAAQLRKALMDLEALRMDKYLIKSALTQELAEAEFNRIVRAATLIANTL